MVLGIVATTAWQEEKIIVTRPGERVAFAGYDLVLRGVVPHQGPNWHERAGLVSVSRGSTAIADLAPSKRIYDAPAQATTEAAIHASWSGDLYVVLGDETTDGGFVMRLYFNPLVRLIWLGALVMGAGGLLSLSDRRLRVGAPRPARSASAPPLPAE
jgi:cytochrome c-type biogenesis protein CcmF